MVGQPPEFEATIRLPIDADGEIADPASFDSAALQLLDGLDKQVMAQSKEALIRACGGSRCDVSSPEVWDEFLRGAEERFVEPGHSLAEYLSRMNRELGAVWKLEDCVSESKLCDELRRKVRASPDMLAEMIFRKALLTSLGQAASFCDLRSGMGDMVESVEK